MQRVTAYNFPGKPNLQFMSWSKSLFICSGFQDVIQKLCFGVFKGLAAMQSK